jgi:hypothetical protein
VLIGFGIGFIGSCIAAALWGIVGFAVFITFGDAANIFYESPIAWIVAWCLTLTPFAIGLIYLCRSVEDSRLTNCLVVAALSVATAIPFSLLDEDPFDPTVVIYYAIEVALALLIGIFWNRQATK